MKEISMLKKGDFFKLNEKTKIVWVYDGYNRVTKKYSAYKFNDICSFREWNRKKAVLVNFEF